MLRSADPGAEHRTAARRLALVFSSFSGGGIERCMLQLADGLTDAGFVVDLVVGQAKGELLAEASKKARIVALDKTPLWRSLSSGLRAEPGVWRLTLRTDLKPVRRLLRRFPSMVEYFRTIGPEAVLAAEPRYNAMAVWARELSGSRARVVISEHDHVSSQVSSDRSWGRPEQTALLRRAYLKADAIVAVSDGVATSLASHADIPKDRITTVHNPVVGRDLRAKAREPLEHPWFAPGEPPVILAVGRLDPQKDFATLLYAFAQLRAERPARLIILGAATPNRPQYARELKELAETLGIAHDVAMPGFVDNPFAFMARASVFVLSSRHEGLPGVLIEALACGCPVVSTDCPSGPAEILDHGRIGPLVPVGDKSALAKAISRVLDNPPPSEMLTSSAQPFTLERAASRYAKLLLGEE